MNNEEIHNLLKIENDYIKELQQENQELKKQLEEYKKLNNLEDDDCE